MTSAERADEIRRLSGLMLQALRDSPQPVSPGKFVRTFARRHEIDLGRAEMALSLLLNQRQVDTDRELHLQVREAA